MTSGRAPFSFGHVYSSMQKRFCVLSPTHFDHGSNSSQIVFRLLLSYQLRLHSFSTSEQYSPETSAIPAGHAAAPFVAGAAGGVFAALAEGATSGIDDETGRALARGAAGAGGARRSDEAFGFAPAQAAASTRTDKVSVTARRMS